MKKFIPFLLLLLSLSAFAGPTYTAEIRELDDFDYPDNPDILTRSEYKGEFSHSEVVFEQLKDDYFNVTIKAKNSLSDDIHLDNIYLMEWIPAIPLHVRKDPYLEKICVINQEWNRQQIRFKEGKFRMSGTNLESRITTRVDFARNCLNSGLWEIITYTTEDGKNKPIYHGWFDFPEGLYSKMFKDKNEQPFNIYKKHLVEWKDPESKYFDLARLRTVDNEESVQFENWNDRLYELAGERYKKEMNIIYPTNYSKIQDFLSDSTLFATFSPPGFYNRDDPRKTELGRFKSLNEVTYRNTSSKNPSESKTFEIQFDFTDLNKQRITKVVLGGLDLNDISALPTSRVNEAFQMPMGIANHSFYEDYETCVTKPSMDNPYFGAILDHKGYGLDSHAVGIDGPMFHFDEDDPTKLHIWFLSFERHALVGHYVIQLPDSVFSNK